VLEIFNVSEYIQRDANKFFLNLILRASDKNVNAANRIINIVQLLTRPFPFLSIARDSTKQAVDYHLPYWLSLNNN